MNVNRDMFVHLIHNVKIQLVPIIVNVILDIKKVWTMIAYVWMLMNVRKFPVYVSKNVLISGVDIAVLVMWAMS